MNKLLIIFMMTITLSWAQEELNKTSQLELFLFKIGFQSLLNDVRDIKTLSNVNSNDLENLSNKMEYIYTQINKNNTQLTDSIINSDSSDDTSRLKVTILDLEKRIKNLENSLKESKKLNARKAEVQSTIQIDEKTTLRTNQIKDEINVLNANVNRNSIDVYAKPNSNSTVIQKLIMNTMVSLEFCDRHGWCKINDNNGYIKKHLLKIVE